MKSLPLFAAAVLTLVLPALGQDGTQEKPDPAVLQRRGTEHFFAGRITEALADWDRVVEFVPEEAPHHWQRGIALYYAGRYQDGVKQFESHQTVNAGDVENAVWHFLCAVRAEGGSVAKARANIYPFAGDTRVPMKEIHALFAGKGSPETVLGAARLDESAPADLRNRLCYAHLYLGLYYEALGDAERSAAHIEKAAADYKMDHYMGKVAQVHRELRGGPNEVDAK